MTTTSTNNKKSKLSLVAKWHANRRRAMIQRHPEILELESSRSMAITLPLLILSNTALAGLSILSGQLSFLSILFLAFGLGSMFSLWQLQILHEVLHGSMLGNGTNLHRRFHRILLFIGSFPSAFGYWLYLQYGHLSHHRSVGVHSLNDAFVSNSMDLADGDVLFVNHRMDMKGESGPQIGGVALSIGRFFYQFWEPGKYVRNAILFSTSFLIERLMLMYNDVVVAFTGRNFFFPNKPTKFHNHVAFYTRVGLFVRVVLCLFAGVLAQSGVTLSIPIPTMMTDLLHSLISESTPMSTMKFLGVPMDFTSVSFWWSWKPILFLMLSETLWSLPPHPACAMFVTNHGSKYAKDDDELEGKNCQPSSSTYAGKWYSIFTLGTNYHVEHHDFPTMPLHQLGKLKKIAGPEFYGNGLKEEKDGKARDDDDDLVQIMKKAFSYPDFYACTNAADINAVAQVDFL